MGGQALSRERAAIAQLSQDLEEGALTRQALNAELKTRSREVWETRDTQVRLERKQAQLKRQIEALRRNTCPQCLLRKADLNATDDFYEEGPQLRYGVSCYGAMLPP